MNIDVRSPFPFAELPRIWKWIEPFRSKVSDDFGPQTLQEFMEFAGAKWNRQKTWAVYADGELGGMIAFERINRWLGTAHWLFKPQFQGRGIAAKASRIAVVAMFEEGIGKLAVYPLAGNLAMGSLLTSLGAVREGKLIEQTLCDGKPTDMWVYGLTEQQFQEKQKHAVSSNDTGTDRSGSIDHRRGLAGPHDDHHADVLAGDAAASAEAARVL